MHDPPPPGEMFVDYCPVPRQKVFLPLGQAFTEVMRLEGYEKRHGIDYPRVFADTVWLKPVWVKDHEGLRFFQNMGWHEPSHTLFLSPRWTWPLDTANSAFGTFQ